jgi:beta-lactamase class A
MMVLAIAAYFTLFGYFGPVGVAGQAPPVLPAGTASSRPDPAANIAIADRPRSTAADQARRVAAASKVARRKESLTAALDAIAAAPGAPAFAVAVLDHRTGISYTFGGNKAFETASVVKVEILAGLLLDARDAGRTLTAKEGRQANIMIRQSDNAAATAMYQKIGSVKGLRAANQTLGLTATVPSPRWGWTRTTASDQVRLLEAIVDPAGPLGDSNQTILNLMGSVVADQDWGVSAAAGAGESTAVKNGWMPRTSLGKGWAVNSVGRITGSNTNVTLAMMSRGHATMSQGIAFLENIARTARTKLAW